MDGARSMTAAIVLGGFAVAAQQRRDFGAGWLGVIGREGDVPGRAACLEQGLYGGGPVRAGIAGGLLSAADGGPHDRGAVPAGVACLDVGRSEEHTSELQ